MPGQPQEKAKKAMMEGWKASKRTPLFSVSWEATILANITKDLYPLIHSYFKRAQPTLKKNHTYKFTSSFGDHHRFDNPDGLAIDYEHKQLYIADSSNNQVQVQDLQTGSFKNFAPDFDFHGPCALAFDDEDNLVVVGRTATDGDAFNCIQVFTRSGELVRQWGSSGDIKSEAGMHNPWGVVINHEGNYIISDNGNGRLLVFTPQGVLLQTIGERGETPGKLKGPTGLAVDDKGIIHVAEWGNHRIQKFDPDGKSLQIISWDVEKDRTDPWGILVDANGDMVMVDSGSHRIKILSREGTEIQTLTKKGVTDKELSYPTSLTIDEEGNLYVSDQTNNRIVVYG